MNGIPSGRGRPEAAEPPKAIIKNLIRKAGSSPDLELQVNIGGRDYRLVLPHDALRDHGIEGPAAVEELRGIRTAIEGLLKVLRQKDRK